MKDKMSGNGNNQKLNGNKTLLNKNQLSHTSDTNGISSQHKSQHNQLHNNNNHNNNIQGESSSTSAHSHILSGHHSSIGNSQSVDSGHISSSSATGNSNSTTIPPKYQPPPQPSGGILKLPTSKSAGYFQQDLNTTHLNIKYPAEIPKLASVYIPESVKNTGNPSRFVQRPSQRRMIGGHIPVLTHGHESHLLRQQHQPQEMLKFARKSDVEQSGTAGSGLVSNTGRLNIEQNRHLQTLISELRALKEANQRLSDDNQELRDLCCFLDDDRQKGRKLAREWQRFGRYTASVMRQEVSAYQSKLRQLDDKQQELIRDNIELKELCLYLDEERAHIAANTLCVNCGSAIRPALRDDGDGSSSSTNADELCTLRQYERSIPELNLRSTLSDQTFQYVRTLERRIRQLEEERLAGPTNAQQIPDPISGRPEAVVRALQVLEVREQLKRDRVGNNSPALETMDDREKALVREMCNVVWRKLEESPNGPNMDPL